MSNLLQRGADWFTDRAKLGAGQIVSIEQGNVAIVGLTAWVSMHEYEVADTEGFLTRLTSYDWGVEASDLGALELRSGARITCGDDVYEVLPIGKLPCVERLDAFGTILKCHSKKVA